MSRKLVTLTDIAEACGTSNVTVSKALSGKSGMSDELREKIIATADRLGYVPTKSAAANGGIIAVLIPEGFTNPNGAFYWSLYNNLVLCLKQEGYSCVQLNLTQAEEDSLTMPAFLGGQNIAGVISLGQLDRRYLDKLAAQTKNLLLLDYYFSDIDIDCVITNGFLGGYRLTCHLIAQGHRKIGFIGTWCATSSIFDRYMGYVKAMTEQGLPIEDQWYIPDREPNNDLIEPLSFPQKLPTAFVCNCDECAFRAIRDLKAIGCSVPDDISIVGYDNYHISEISDPPITTINVDAKEMAATAVATLLERIRNPKLPTKIQILDGKLIEKASVRKL